MYFCIILIYVQELKFENFHFNLLIPLIKLQKEDLQRARTLDIQMH